MHINISMPKAELDKLIKANNGAFEYNLTQSPRQAHEGCKIIFSHKSAFVAYATLKGIDKNGFTWEPETLFEVKPLAVPKDRGWRKYRYLTTHEVDRLMARFTVISR